MHHIITGNHGEELACNFLLKNGYSILARNYRYGRLELDIIALKNETVVVVEVKMRTSQRNGHPYQAVTLKKQKQIIKAANAYLQEAKESKEVRFDVISIIANRYKEELNHISNAFYPL